VCFNPKIAQALVLALCVATTVSLRAQTVTTLASFDGTNGQYGDYPGSVPVQGANGNFYGITASGGANGEGVVFIMTPQGKLSTLYNFCSQPNCTDGYIPTGKLVLGANGNLYGTTTSGGTNRWGTFFEITPSGKLTTLYNFCSFSGCPDGYNPQAGVVLGADGNFYGTTTLGGANGVGSVFKITPAGTLTTLASFNGANGANPDFGTLIQASDGNLYGTTEQGGTDNYGTVFRITPGGTLTTLYNFCSQNYPTCTDGYSPYGGLAQAANGKFYGATIGGGANGYGTIFEITSLGHLNTLHSFDFSDGETPEASLILGSDGNLYGSTPSAGSHNGGTAFEITPTGTFTTLYNFCAQTDCSDGSGEFGGLMQATNGKFYGPTLSGGVNDLGIIFSLSTGLRQFVETVPTTAKVGAKVMIVGNTLKGATAVTFNGTAAAFTVVSNTEIKAVVPTGATTGPVQVVTPSGALNSNVSFRIAP